VTVHLSLVSLIVKDSESAKELSVLGQIMQVIVNVFVFLFVKLQHRATGHEEFFLTEIYNIVRL